MFPEVEMPSDLFRGLCPGTTCDADGECGNGDDDDDDDDDDVDDGDDDSDDD